MIENLGLKITTKGSDFEAGWIWDNGSPKLKLW